MYILYKENEESLDHLLGSYIEATYLWEKEEELFRQSNKIRDDTPRTIEEWGNISSRIQSSIEHGIPSQASYCGTYG
jgi:hypothetical protein